MTLQGESVRMYFVNADRVIWIQIPEHCCQSQSDGKEKQGAMFFQTDGGGFGVVYTVPCAAIHVVVVVFLFYTAQEWGL